MCIRDSLYCLHFKKVLHTAGNIFVFNLAQPMPHGLTGISLSKNWFCPFLRPLAGKRGFGARGELPGSALGNAHSIRFEIHVKPDYSAQPTGGNSFFGWAIAGGLVYHTAMSLSQKSIAKVVKNPARIPTASTRDFFFKLQRGEHITKRAEALIGKMCIRDSAYMAVKRARALVAFALI